MFPELDPEHGWDHALELRRCSLAHFEIRKDDEPEVEVPGPGWSLRQWLSDCLATKGNTLSKDDVSRLRALQKKIENFGRLFARYDNNMRRVVEDQASAGTLEKFALLLLRHSVGCKDLSALSTAMKVNEMLVKKSTKRSLLLLECLKEELRILEAMG